MAVSFKIVKCLKIILKNSFLDDTPEIDDSPMQLWINYDVISKAASLGVVWCSDNVPFNLALVNIETRTKKGYKWILRQSAIANYKANCSPDEMAEIDLCISEMPSSVVTDM